MSADELSGAAMNGWRKELDLGNIIPFRSWEVGILKKTDNCLKKQKKDSADRNRKQIPDHLKYELGFSSDDELQNSDIDMQLVFEARKELIKGEYHIPAGKIAEAMLEEALWVEKWLF